MVDKKALKKQFLEEWKKHYALPFFSEEGFIRNTCKLCGQTFWSLEERDVCGDPAHTGYLFIGEGVGKRSDYCEAWERMADFYVKHGHSLVPRYPVVARWRDDMYFTIASIAVFQPYVVSGEVDPPANPLLIPQPCLRFNDVDNVGISGRHMTNFVMVGQHAFNREKHVLWKNEAVELMYRYLTSIGIPAEEIIFHEDVWAGGGNFGPSIEYFVRGLELGNIVFMQFEETDSGYRELKIKVIDHGIGLSRFSWITQGTPTAYDVVFPSVVEYLRSFHDADIPLRAMERYFSLSGKLNFDEVENVEDVMRSVEDELGIPNFFDRYKPFAELYAIGDHTLTILFSVCDGAFPSNVGGGYNLRVLARRVFSAMDKYGWDIDFYKIFELHASDQKLFPELKDAVPTAADVMDVERRKYEESRRRGYSKIISVYNRKGTLEPSDFVLFYQSYGVPPEEVEKITNVNAPKGIYSQLSKSDSCGREERKLDVSGYPKTKLLFYDDEKMYEFTARVIGVVGSYVVLDKTAFYPEGGGQESDTGELNGVRVLGVIKVDGVVLHDVEKPEVFRKGDEVIGRVDVRRRELLKKHHTAAHLLLAACREVIGRHVWQSGAKKTVNGAHMDISHYKRISREEIRKIEFLVNRYIQMNVPVRKYFLPRNEAEKRFGVGIYQGGAVPGKILRIVEIEGIDVEACGGTHVDSTGEVGLFKIVRRESVADGVERIYYAVSDLALEYVLSMEERIERAAEILKVPSVDIVKGAEKVVRMWKGAEKELESVIRGLSGYVDGKVVVFDDITQRTADLIGNGKELVIVALNSRPNVFVYGEDARKKLDEIIRKFGGKGGGKGSRAAGVVENIKGFLSEISDSR